MVKGFSTTEAAVEVYPKLVLDISTSEWHKCFESWLGRIEKCIEFKGEYFDKE